MTRSFSQLGIMTRVGLLATASSLASPLAARSELLANAQPEGVVATPSRLPAPASTARGARDIRLTVPAKDGATYLGDISILVGADQQVQIPAERALQLLSNVLDPNILETLRSSFQASENVTPEEFARAGLTVAFDAQRIELVFTIPAELRAARSVAISAMSRERVGDVLAPLESSAYLNLRGSFDLVEDGINTGFQSPTLLLDGAVRLGDVVAESDAIWSPDANGAKFQRLGSRLVHDDTAELIRWTAGDLETTSRGFQGAPEIAGISLSRSYSLLNPQQIIRPRGDRSFRLERPATIEVLVNGQQVRRLQLGPGNYNLSDFPFAEGANDVRLNILDDAGRSETLRFNVFLDQTQLASGLSEFGVYAGVHAPLGQSGPRYSDDWAFSGFYRRGLSDYVTVGINAQADDFVQMAGAEAVFATQIGTIGLQGAVSEAAGVGSGYATRVSFQRLIQRGNGMSDTFNLFAERRSTNFAPVSVFLSPNQYSYEVGGGYSHAFSNSLYAGLDGRFAKGRGTSPDVASVRLTGGYRINDRLTLNLETRYSKDSFSDEVSGFLSLAVRLGSYSSARGEYDTRGNRARASYQTLRGSGVGSYNVTTDVETSDFGSGFSVNGNYFDNRAELGLSHYGAFAGNFGESVSQRTNVRVGTSIAVGGGAVAIGRPIYDSFAIVKPHESLEQASVVIEPTTYGYTGETGALGTAVMPSLSSYSERTVTVDLEGAPAGVDIGQGSFRLFPAYRSGYMLEVGSDYNVTAIGTMVDIDGEPVSLVAGTATELANPEREPVTIFTNRQGRFGASGLAPGNWRLEMLDGNKSTYDIEIPDDAKGVVRLGEIRANGSNR